jgi:hypothetical protein
MTKSATVLRLNNVLTRYGFYPYKLKAALLQRKIIKRDAKEFERQRLLSPSNSEFSKGRYFPFFEDRNAAAGEARGHYFHQDLFVAQQIFRNQPLKHYDVGSSISGFVSHVASFREIHILDVRPLSTQVPNMHFTQCDVMNLESKWEAVTDSLSCLHALEHFGLGRYGDPIDYDGWRKGILGLRKMLKEGGTLYLSVPTGRHQRVEFNAHRVFSLPFIRDELLKYFSIVRAEFVTDDGSLLNDIDIYSECATRSYDAEYGCSIWTLQLINR